MGDSADKFKLEMDSLSQQLMGKSNPSNHGIMFIVTRGSSKLMIDLDQDLYDCDMFDTEDMEDIVDNHNDLPDEPGIYQASIEIQSYRCNHPLDPEEWDLNVNISNITFLTKPIDLIK